MNELLFLLPALLACWVLTGIHTYLGIHVVARGVIFVDIALAQIAALGMTLAFLLGFPPETPTAYFFTLGFTSVTALGFAFLRDDRIPQEALIGISFAVSSALAILLADAIPHGSEHLKYILSGNILWVTWPQIGATALIYAGLGAFHYLFRKPLLLVSTDPESARRRGIRVRMWDLLFYLSFAIVITSSVQIGGILLVFSFLIVPAACSILFFRDLRKRVVFGWVMGAVVSAVGILISYACDLPTGPSIVALFGVALIGSLIVKKQ